MMTHPSEGLWLSACERSTTSLPALRRRRILELALGGKMSARCRRSRVHPALAALFLLVATGARAHHLGLEHAFGPSQPMTMVLIEIEAGGFNLGGVRGRYTTQALTAQYAPAPFVAFSARLPSHFLGFDALQTRFGLGDVEVGAKVRLFGQTDRYVLAVGTNLETPTGDTSIGVGSGHFSVVPYLTGGVSLGSWSFAGLVGGAFATDGAAAVHPHPDGTLHEHVNYVNPHTDRELFTHVSVTYGFTSRFIAFANLDAVYPRTGPDLSKVLLRGMLGGGMAPSPYSRLTLSAALPIAGPRRYEWKVNFAIQFLLGIPE
jgi:hypothetical protein